MSGRCSWQTQTTLTRKTVSFCSASVSGFGYLSYVIAIVAATSFHPDHFRPEGHEAGGRALREEVGPMRRQYDFTNATRNPYAARLKRQVTIRLDEPTIRYFKQLAEETGVRYQTLINLYLRDCAASGRKLALTWKPAA